MSVMKAAQWDKSFPVNAGNTHLFLQETGKNKIFNFPANKNVRTSCAGKVSFNKLTFLRKKLM